MGRGLMWSGVFALVALLLLQPAAAQDDKPNPRDVAAVRKCIKAKTGRNWAWENCLGIVSKTCIKNEASMPSQAVAACYYREQAAWNDLLNESLRGLQKRLDGEQQQKLREMQEAWTVSREKTCAFLYDYFQGTMAIPMVAACMSRETGRHALFLFGFLEDAEGR
jgi:uncharacterized protein YecT (DUF1311 family)